MMYSVRATEMSLLQLYNRESDAKELLPISAPQLVSTPSNRWGEEIGSFLNL
jgi:hypothetical protein